MKLSTPGILGAIVGAMGIGAAAHGAAIPSLGSASDFALLSVPGGSDWKLSNVTINGNVGMGNNGSNNSILNNMAPSTVTGNVYMTVNTGTQYTGPGNLGGSVILN